MKEHKEREGPEETKEPEDHEHPKEPTAIANVANVCVEVEPCLTNRPQVRPRKEHCFACRGTLWVYGWEYRLCCQVTCASWDPVWGNIGPCVVAARARLALRLTDCCNTWKCVHCCRCCPSCGELCCTYHLSSTTKKWCLHCMSGKWRLPLVYRHKRRTARALGPPGGWGRSAATDGIPGGCSGAPPWSCQMTFQNTSHFTPQIEMTSLRTLGH
jgi:hypothetical protein